MTAFFYYIDLNWIIEALVGLGIYTVLLFVFKAVPKEFFKEVMKKRQGNDNQPLSPG